MVHSTSQLWGAELNGVLRAMASTRCHLDLLAGFRYLDLCEQLDLAGNINVGQVIVFPSIQDEFQTRNQFYGGQLGARFNYRWHRLSAEITGKIALGVTRQSGEISGQTTVTRAGAALFGLNPGTVPGGFLTQPTSIGQQSRDQFGFVPSGQFKLNWDLNSHWQAFVG